MTRYTPLWEQAGSYAASVDRRLIGALWPAAAVTGCAVTVTTAMNMNVAAGTVVAPTANNTGSVLCYSDAVETVTATTAPASGQNRIDLVVCQPRGNDLDGGANNDFIFAVVAGTAATAGSEAAPAVPAGAVALAQVRVIGGSASLSAGNLSDRRSAAPLTPGMVKARAYRAAAYSAVGGAAIPFDTASYDPFAGFSLVGGIVPQGVYVCPAAGDYLCTGQYIWTASAASQGARAQLTKNGAGVAYGPGSVAVASGNILGSLVSDVVPCAVGDQLSIVQFGVPAGVAIATGAGNTFMTVRLLA